MDGKRVGWAQVAKTGQFWDPRYGHFSLSHEDLALMLSNFKAGVVGADIPFDFNHGIRKADSAEKGKAAGWVRDMELRAEGEELWALAEWTEEGAEKIEAKEYRYISPSFSYEFKPSEGDRRGQSVGPTIYAAALTNTPVLSMAPLTLSRETLELAADGQAAAVFSYDEQRRRIQSALTEKFAPYTDDVYGPCWGVYLVDLFDGRAIYRTYGGDTYEISFAIGADGAVSFTSAPAEVVATWTPLASQETHMSKQPAATETVTVKDHQGKDVTLAKSVVDELVRGAGAPVPSADQVDLAKQVTDLQATVTSQGATITELSKKNAELALARATDAVTQEVDACIRQGTLLPRDRQEFIDLALSHRALFDRLMKDRPKIVDLAGPRGSSEDAPAGAAEKALDLAISEEQKADPTLTREQAYARALDKNPALYQAGQ